MTGIRVLRSMEQELNLRLQMAVFAHDIKSRTVRLFWGKVAMPHYQCLGIAVVQRGKQLCKRTLLLRCAGVLRSLAISGETAHVAHPDGMAVMVMAVRPDNSFRTSLLHSSVSGYDIVVATAFPPEPPVVMVDVPHSDGTAHLAGGTVHDNQSDGSHKLPPIIPPAAPVTSSSIIRTMYSTTVFQFVFIRVVFK